MHRGATAAPTASISLLNVPFGGTLRLLLVFCCHLELFGMQAHSVLHDRRMHGATAALWCHPRLSWDQVPCRHHVYLVEGRSRLPGKAHGVVHDRGMHRAAAALCYHQRLSWD